MQIDSIGIGKLIMNIEQFFDRKSEDIHDTYDISEPYIQGVLAGLTSAENYIVNHLIREQRLLNETI